MGNIVLLDDHTINKIAAGEVIERPASVVKELMENSIDAGATQIKVEIKNGGISYIRITDNGKGIAPDDMEIAFERHATSKIRQAEDLEKVTSMGFRGEALASVAAISKIEMLSKTADNEIGSKIEIEGGRMVNQEEAGCPKGTTITIQDLFFNTPVRYKFLKKDFTEAGYIEDVVTRIALVHPEIAIVLISSGKTIIQTPGNGDSKAVIYSIYGKDVAENILDVNYEYEDMKVTGVIGKPVIARSNRSNQLFFVNQRYIKDRTLTSAAEAGYKGMITIGKYGFLVLNIKMNPQKVDVNVHPAKLEVRFEEESKVFKAIFHAIKDTLLRGDLVANTERMGEANREVSQDKIAVNARPVETKQHTSLGGLFRKIAETEEMQERQKVAEELNQIDTKPQTETAMGNSINTGIDRNKELFNSEETEKAQVNGQNSIESELDKLQVNGQENIESKTEKLQVNEQDNIENEPVNSQVNEQNRIESELVNNQELADKSDLLAQMYTSKFEDEIDAQSNKNEVAENTEGANYELPVNGGINENYDLPTEGGVAEFSNISDLMPKPSFLEHMEPKKDDDETKLIDTQEINEKLKEGIEQLENLKVEEKSENFDEMYIRTFGTMPTEVRRQAELEKMKEQKITLQPEEMKPVENISIFEEEEKENKIPAYKFIGIAFSTYIILELDKELYILDQHAAHERILYEKVKKNYYSEEAKDSQLMLLPDIINLSHKEMDIAKENMDMFRKAGFTLDEFGENTIKLSGVPNICIDLDTKELFLETLDEINTVARTAKQEKEEKFIATVACKAAVKANMALTREEVDTLMDQLLLLPNPFTCPHGRPTAIKMTKTDIEKKFSRR